MENNIWDIYSKALEQYEAKNFDAALKILNEVKKLAPNYQKAYMLEYLIWDKLDERAKEAAALEKLFSLFDLSSSEERALAVGALKCLTVAYRFSKSPAEEQELALLSAKLTDDNADACRSISYAIFLECCKENSSAADFRALYDEYKKNLEDIQPFAKKFYEHKKIRVGFLSRDFRRHVTMRWSWALLTELNKNCFEVYCYSNLKNPDEDTNRLRNAVDNWRDIFALTDKQAAQLIRDDEIDILFDLAGHTVGNRLRVAAYRPASVQISGIGYMNSTGLNCFDYFWSDVHCAGNAAAMEEYFAEKIIRLPHSHFCYNPSNNLNPAPALPCIKNGYVTFGSFNNFKKMADSILIAWKKILDAVPNSRLILKNEIFGKDDGKSFASKRLKSFGFDLARVEMRPSTAEYLREYADVDIALDTFPYTGGVTTCEALYMGVPVVSLCGDIHGRRFGYSILKNIGLEELAVDSYDEYIKRAVALAGDWELLMILRKNLRAMMKKSPLMDSKGYVREVEEAFTKILNDERKIFQETDEIDVNKLYSKALEQYNARNFDAALKILDEIKSRAPDYRNAYSLEGNIWEKLENVVKRYYATEKLLPLLKFSSTKEKNFSALTLTQIGGACGGLTLCKEAYDFHLLAARISCDERLSLMALDNAIFVANFSESFSAANFHECYDEYKKNLARLKIYPFARKFYNHEKIRVGFMSADFRKNAMVYWAWSLLTNLDKNRFETYFYSDSKISDKITAHFRSLADSWQEIFALDDKQAAQLIYDDEIDILFDLSGHLPGNRLRVAAYHPASVQVFGIGYMNSTGMDFFDYFWSDVHCAGNAAAMKEYFNEKIIRLPHSHICYEPYFTLEPAPAPPCLKNGYVTFGCFNKFNKVTDKMFDAWKKILDAVPNSRLILKYDIFNTDDGKDFVGKRLESLGVDLARVEMRPFTKNYLNEYADMDIALDTFPYTGGVTTCEALYMGVPVVSLYGDIHGRRFGLSILKNIGLDELAVKSYEEYINRAVALAGDWELLTVLRKNLRAMMKKSPLMDSKGYAREAEEAFIKILNDERKDFLWKNQ